MAKHSDSSSNSSAKRITGVPWMAVGLGSAVTLVGLLILSWVLGNFLVQPPDEVPVVIAPTIVRLTAPPVPTATISLNPPTPTVAPTATTAATPDFSVAPAELTVGYYARVGDTGGVGVTVRNGPSTRNLPVLLPLKGHRCSFWMGRRPAAIMTGGRCACPTVWRVGRPEFFWCPRPRRSFIRKLEQLRFGFVQ